MWEARRPAPAASASPEEAESRKGVGPGAGRSDAGGSPASSPGPSAGGTSSASIPVCRGASSTIRWALVPETPKEETPARRLPPFDTQSTDSSSRETDPASQST